jgi:hypothetical protein
MFSPETEKLVNELIQAEYLNAVVNFGEKYHSLHEAYAVLLEEVEEVEYGHKDLKIWFDEFWETIKNDSRYYDESVCVSKMLEEVYHTISELAQVGAVLQKIKNTLEGNA